MTEEKKKRSPKDGPALKTGGRDARRIGALVLEVLAGERSPTEAAAALEVGLPRYYQLEKQALEGLLTACEPREKGRRQKPVEKLLAEKELEKRRLERDLNRTQALLRASQKTAGVMPAVKKDTPGGRKRRKPEVRALKVARSLAKRIPEEPEADPAVSGSGESVSCMMFGETEAGRESRPATNALQRGVRPLGEAPRRNALLPAQALGAEGQPAKG